MRVSTSQEEDKQIQHFVGDRSEYSVLLDFQDLYRSEGKKASLDILSTCQGIFVLSVESVKP